VTVWRISNHATLDGAGGLRASARWHTKGRLVVYCATSPAAALLEVLVHHELRLADLPSAYKLIRIHCPNSLPQSRILASRLPRDWRNRLEITRAIGDEWLSRGHTPLLAVPSVVVPETLNLLINPAHPRSRKIRIAGMQQFQFDPRLK
jgi:RES domain-containing protein